MTSHHASISFEDWRMRDISDRILLSHDVCLRSHVRASGGPGYTLLFREFIPRLLAAGFSDDDITTLTQTNPMRALTGVAGPQ